MCHVVHKQATVHISLKTKLCCSSCSSVCTVELGLPTRPVCYTRHARYVLVCKSLPLTRAATAQVDRLK